MKKFLAITCCLLLLSGCAKSTESDLPQIIETYLMEQSAASNPLGANRTKEYYKYYLPLDMGTRESTQLGEVILKNESMILMNFNPSSIIIHSYYTGSEEEIQKQEEERRQAREDGRTEADLNEEMTEGSKEDTATSATTSLQESDLASVNMQIDSTVFTYAGTYKTISESFYPYTLTIIKSGNQYLMYLDGGVVEFYSLSPLASVLSDIKSMFLIMKSISFDTNYVLENFSMKNATSSRQQSIDTLQQNLPSAGSIPDLLEQMEILSGKR